MNVLRAPCCDASRMALLCAMRRDWAPRTAPWQAWTQEALFQVAIEIDVAARAAQELNPFEDPS